MTFGEKLYRLRKKYNYTQESLAERLGTTRQAVSKWENDQSLPDIDKVVQISQIFDVTIDYLLKNSEYAGTNDESTKMEDRYFVSREEADHYLRNQRKVGILVSIGIGLLIASAIPYLSLKDRWPLLGLLLTIVVVLLGISNFAIGIIKEDDIYRKLEKEVLMFEPNHLKELRQTYKQVLKKTVPFLIIGIVLFVGGILIPFLAQSDVLTEETIALYYLFCLGLVALGFLLILCTSIIIESHRLLARNEEYTNRFTFRLRKKVRKKINQFLDR